MAAYRKTPRSSSTHQARLIAVTLLTVAGATPVAAASDAIFGTWLRDDGNARVRVAPCGGAICATNLWIRDPQKQGEKVGDRLEFNIKPDGGGWRGNAYDPQRNLTFSTTLSAEGNAMTTKGCMVAGMICRTTTWQRLAPTTASQ
ncbi:MAG: DUF2147 domain-containing protein [Pseudolabrys sp.]|nr:DUF2147 domain-containing protein [Pseudolabrys sp.]